MCSTLNGASIAVPRRCRCWTAWALSAAALGAVFVPGGAPWAALLLIVAIARWAWLVHEGRRDPEYRDVPASGLSELLVASSRTAGNDLRALRADLGQVRLLVRDAAVTLGDGFQGLSETMQNERATPGCAAAPEITENIEVLVRSLQFEDVARQLLEYCDHQVAGLETYADDVVALLSDEKLRLQPAEWESRLVSACENYLENSRLWAARRQRHITQTSVQAGEVELF